MKPGDASATITLIDYGLIRFQNSTFVSNTYIWQIPETESCVLIDPGLDGQVLDDYLSRKRLNPVLIVCTHGHFDHLGSVELFQKKYQAKCHLHFLDVKTSKSSNFLMMACKIPARIRVPTADYLIEDGHTIPVGSALLRFYHTPGHTPGSCFIELGNYVFSGDSLYRSTVGLVDFPGEDKSALRRSLLKMIDLIPGGKMICPGHGGSALLETIIKSNSDLRAFLGLGGSAEAP